MEYLDYEKVFNICKELFQVRNYTITNDIRNENSEWCIKGVTGENKKIHLYIITQDKLNIDLIKYYYSIIHTKNIRYAILVYQNSVTSSVKKILENIDIPVELFCIDELKYNILKHVRVPIHTKIGSSKKNDKKFPILKRADPVSRFMGYKHGDIIRIDRNDGTICYRYVK